MVVERDWLMTLNCVKGNERISILQEYFLGNKALRLIQKVIIPKTTILYNSEAIYKCIALVWFSLYEL